MRVWAGVLTVWPEKTPTGGIFESLACFMGYYGVWFVWTEMTCLGVS